MVSSQNPGAILRLMVAVGQIMSTCSLVLMILLSLLVFFDATMRTLGHPTIWVFETSLYFYIFVGFLGNALAVKKKVHFRVTFLMELLPGARRFFNLVSDLSVLAFGALLLASGIYFTHYLWDHSISSSSLMETPMWIPSLAIPLGGLGLILQTIVTLNQRANDAAGDQPMHG